MKLSLNLYSSQFIYNSKHCNINIIPNNDISLVELCNANRNSLRGNQFQEREKW